MTKHYDLTMKIDDNASGDNILLVSVNHKTMDTLQQLIRLSMSDFNKVDPTPPMKRRRLFGGSKMVEPPLEPLEPIPEDVENI